MHEYELTDDSTVSLASFAWSFEVLISIDMVLSTLAVLPARPGAAVRTEGHATWDTAAWVVRAHQAGAY
jgi:hypothetical protein